MSPFTIPAGAVMVVLVRTAIVVFDPERKAIAI
jgi:hypothetical protein